MIETRQLARRLLAECERDRCPTAGWPSAYEVYQRALSEGHSPSVASSVRQLVEVHQSTVLSDTR